MGDEPTWTKEKATLELRWRRSRTRTGSGAFDFIVVKELQQLFKVTRGYGGRVIETDEWRDIPIVEVEQ
jgi:hypothetical protein